MMQVTIDMPEDIAERWQAQCNGNIPRAVLQSVVLEAYRQRIIGEGRLQQWLGLPTRMEVHRRPLPMNYAIRVPRTSYGHGKRLSAATSRISEPAVC